MHCRFYENEFPEVGTVVVCEITSVDQAAGAYVALLEYDNKEGMIMANECSNKKIKNLSWLLKIGKREPVLVTKVDKSGFIDLSRKRVRAEDIKECEDRYNRALKVNNIAKQSAYSLGVELIEIYE